MISDSLRSANSEAGARATTSSSCSGGREAPTALMCIPGRRHGRTGHNVTEHGDLVIIVDKWEDASARWATPVFLSVALGTGDLHDTALFPYVATKEATSTMSMLPPETMHTTLPPPARPATAPATGQAPAPSATT